LQLADNGAGGQMSQHRPIPRLDLAPNLRRPLSPWNPLDYLRLLYWIFFFPQALRQYVHVYGGLIPNEHPSRKPVWLLLPNNTLRQLVLQGIVLTVIAPLAQGLVLNKIGFLLDYNIILANSILIIILGIPFCFFIILSETENEDINSKNTTQTAIPLCVGLSVTISLAISTFSATSKEVFTNFAAITALSLIGGCWLGVAGAVVLSLLIDVSNFVGVTVGIGMLLLSGFIGLMMPAQKVATDIGIVRTVLFFMSSGAASIVGSCLAFLRPENWLFSFYLAQKFYKNNLVGQLPHVTWLPIPYLSSQLKQWLRHDWEKGIINAKQIFVYTLQFIPVINALNQLLAEIPLEQVIYRVAQLAEPPYNWELLRYVSVPWFSNPFRFRTDTAARAAAAGFWFLHEKMLRNAVEAFAVVRSLPYGEEMLLISLTLSTFNSARNVRDIATLELPAFPKEPLLRPATWEALTSLRRIAEDIQIIQHSLSHSARAFALSRAIGELKKFRDKPYAFPELERELIKTIVWNWTVALLDVASEVGKVSITERIHNSYVVGDPVEGNLFVGREDVLRQLEELWVMRSSATICRSLRTPTHGQNLHPP
jgi:hypothetical protein